MSEARYETVIEPPELASRLADPDWVVVDCRFELADPEAGRRAYLAAHIPGAVYAHLDEDLSHPPVTDHGRHPLPPATVMANRFGRLGISAEKQVVVYDDSSGGIAARLWWMLHFMGHAKAAVLNGGWTAWLEAGLPGCGGAEHNAPATFSGRPRAEWRVTMPEVMQAPLLVDSRDPARYRGDEEPIDPRAGHIPGAVNHYYRHNWTDSGRLLSPAALHRRLGDLLGDTPAAEAVFYCGSGVSACANLLALAYAGLGPARLYVGSWSEWCRQPDNPAATGPTPAGREPDSTG